MIALAAIAIATSVLSATPMPLTDVQQEMLTAGMFEPDSFREPAFEALIENVRTWPNHPDMLHAIDLYVWGPETIAVVLSRRSGMELSRQSVFGRL